MRVTNAPTQSGAGPAETGMKTDFWDEWDKKPLPWR
jgi:hypothetical protein